jgi:hypothetical protein
LARDARSCELQSRKLPIYTAVVIALATPRLSPGWDIPATILMLARIAQSTPGMEPPAARPK